MSFPFTSPITFNIISGFTSAPISKYAVWNDDNSGFYSVDAWFKGVGMPLIATECSFSTDYPFGADDDSECLGGTATASFFNGSLSLLGNKTTILYPLGTVATNRRVTATFSALSILPSTADIVIRYKFAAYPHVGLSAEEIKKKSIEFREKLKKILLQQEIKMRGK